MAKSQIESKRLLTFNLSEKGVVITKSPVHGEDGELVVAQNAVPNPEGGLSGIRKRFGFSALNASPASGPILAFISLNLEDPGVIAVNPAAFGKWLYSTDAGVTWSYLEVQQEATSIPINYDGNNRLAFLHTLVDTDKTGLIAADQVASLNVWEESAVPAEGNDPGRVAFPIPHTLDLGDGFLYYWGAAGLSIRRWGYGVDAELTDLTTDADITGIVDWTTDGTDIWILCSVDSGGALPDNHRVYKVTVSSGTFAKVGTVIASSFYTDAGTQYPVTEPYSICWINLNGDTPNIVVACRRWVQATQTLENTTKAQIIRIAATASDATTWTDVIAKYDTKDVPTGYATALLTLTQSIAAPPSSLDTYSTARSAQFNAGDTVRVGDITYTAVEKAGLGTPNTFFRGGVWTSTAVAATGTFAIDEGSHAGMGAHIHVGWPTGTPAHTLYTYKGGIDCLALAINGSGGSADGVGTGTAANPLARADAYGQQLRATARASGAAGNGIVVAETSSVASWDASTLAGGVYTVQAYANKVKAHDLMNDATKGVLYVAVASDGGHSEIYSITYPLIAGAWTPALTERRTMKYPFGYIGVWADNDELLYLETPEAIANQLTKGIMVGTAVFYLLGTGIESDATIHLIALVSGALQRIELPS